ncbi:p104 [Rhizobium phage 16-3]|uniref:p104 n=1 Tax=Rhizobium phage 16-3 TaxID=10704 RepID=UPI00017BA661|nr:p104 [Rhizobium phage 16-3]ABF71350.1 p104 [Rhizobium phage 16-3]
MIITKRHHTEETEMIKTFAALKKDALNASSTVELFRIAKASNDKLRSNVAKAQMMSYTHGRAAEADHYFQNVIPAWQAINNEIHAMLRKAMEGKSAEEVVEIIKEAA